MSTSRSCRCPTGTGASPLAVDQASGDLYIGYVNTSLAFETPNPDLYRLEETSGALVKKLAIDKPTSVATDAAGGVYAFDQVVERVDHKARIVVFDPNGNPVETFAEGEISESTGLATASGCFSGATVGIYVTGFSRGFDAADALLAYGFPDPAICPPPPAPPEINAQFATTVGSEDAVLKAEINAHYFTANAGTTTYYLQWATAQCIEAGGWEAGCVGAQPTPPGSTLTSVPTNTDVTTAGIVLSGLSPGTEYRYRFVAEGSGAPGEPVFGAGGKPGVEGTEASFTTSPRASAPPACANDVWRSGEAAILPNCRAYELVSPLDKSNGDISPATTSPVSRPASIRARRRSRPAGRASPTPPTAPSPAPRPALRQPVRGQPRRRAAGQSIELSAPAKGPLSSTRCGRSRTRSGLLGRTSQPSGCRPRTNRRSTPAARPAIRPLPPRHANGAFLRRLTSAEPHLPALPEKFHSYRAAGQLADQLLGFFRVKTRSRDRPDGSAAGDLPGLRWRSGRGEAAAGQRAARRQRQRGRLHSWGPANQRLDVRPGPRRGS